MSPKITLSPELETFIAQGLTLKKKGPGRMSKKVKETEAERVSLELKNLIEKVSLMSNCPLVSLSTPFEITPISHFRVLKVQDNKSLIHHLFQPNKDEWIDQVLAVSPLSDSSTVSAQWLYDSANANAILDIQDYIVADGKLFHAPVQLQPAPKKPTPKKKRKTSDDESDIDIVLDDSPIDTTDRKKRKTAVAAQKTFTRESSQSSQSVRSQSPAPSDNSDKSSFGFGIPRSDKNSGSEFAESDVSGEDSGSDAISSASVEPDDVVGVYDDDLVLRPGSKRRESDDEDDGLMEPVPIWILKCRKSYIEVVPIVEVVDLDAKIMAKSRKTEFELMDKPDMLNISCNRASTEKQEECIRF